MLSFGFVEGDFVVRISDRNAWVKFAQARGVSDEAMPDFLNLIDKLEREKPEVLTEKLVKFGATLEEVKNFVANPQDAEGTFQEILTDLKARGFGDRKSVV